MSDSMTLADVADASGIPARTIRFYIARGILDGPVKAGRGASYTERHVARLEEIKKLQARGRTLSEIAGAMGSGSPDSALAPPTPWWQHAVAEDVVVWVRAGTSPWRLKQVRAALGEFAQHLQAVTETKQEKGQI
jgi:DNA-binding transcriptional MerR regulator